VHGKQGPPDDAVSGSLVQLSERVWYLPAHPDPQRVQPLVGVVVGRQETVLIDAGNTPALARHLRAELERRGAPPVTRIIYTHHHWDHVFGACAYDDPEVIAHNRCRERLKTQAANPWSPAFLETEVARDPSLATMAEMLRSGVDDWTTFVIAVPDRTFDHSLTVSGDGYRLELRHVGGRHADDSITVEVADEEVLFVGDSFYPPPLRLNPSDTSIDTRMLRELLRWGCHTYIDGHSEPISRSELTEWLAANP
jgi:glyoxylase-like metal-dependent hydrolase (beta-lactamase superfamily II)